MPTKKSISKTKAVELINNSKGKFFTVVFTDKKNQERTMNCRLNVSRKVEAGSSPKPLRNANMAKLGYITVWEPKNADFRTINTQTISSLRINKNSYNIK